MLKTQLRDLHAYLLRERALKEEAEEAARKSKRLKAKIDSCQKALDEHLSKLKATKVAIHEKEVSIKANQDLIAKYRKQKQAATDQKQLDALTHQIDNVTQENNVLEEAALEAMALVDDLAAKAPELESAVKAAAAALAAFEAESKADSATRQSRLAETHKLVEAAEAALAPEPKAAYSRIFAQLGADALAECRRRSCVGCFTEVTGQQHNDLLSGRLVVCKSCSRLLYDPD